MFAGRDQDSKGLGLYPAGLGLGLRLSGLGLVLVSDSLVLITSLPAAVYDTKLYCLEEKAMQHRKLAKDKNLWHVSCAVYK